MKKLLLIAISIMLMIFPSVAYAEEKLVPDFSENFESFETDKWIEDTSNFDTKWSNNVLDKGDALGMDSHLKERAKIISDGGNKVLWLKNMEGGNSYFYISPKGDYRYKNFESTFRVKFLEGNDGWISLNLRKDANVWYTGCNNLNLVISVAKDKKSVITYPYRNMPGSPDQVLKETATIENDGYTVSKTAYVNDDKQYEGDWFNIKYVVQNVSFKVYIDDFLVLDLNYPSKKVNSFGYISLNGCATNVYFDDLVITNKDTTAPPPLEEIVPSPVPSPSNPPASQPPSKNPNGCNKTSSLFVPVLLLLSVFTIKVIR